MQSMTFALRASSVRFLSSLILLVAALPAAAFQTIHQFVPLPQCDQQMVAFQALDKGGHAAGGGHAGMLPLGMRPYASPGFPPALWGAWFTWSREGALLTYASGTLGSTAILAPSGAAITDVRGATGVSSALDVLVDAPTGNIVAATLYSGLYFWTPAHLYLLLVGGPPTVYEVTMAGAPIAGVRGVSTLAASIADMDPSPFVMASLLSSGALVYTDSRLILATTSGTLATSEVLFGAASLGGVRGILPMGGSATPALLTSAAYVWTSERVCRFSSGPGGVSLTELLTPAGGSLHGTWGMARQTEEWNGAGVFVGAATIFTPEKQWFTNTIGPIPVQEVIDTASTSIASSVFLDRKAAMLRQTGALHEAGAWLMTGTSTPRAGSVVAGGQ